MTKPSIFFDPKTGRKLWRNAVTGEQTWDYDNALYLAIQDVEQQELREAQDREKEEIAHLVGWEDARLKSGQVNG